MCVCLSACVFAAALVPGRAAAHGLSRTISPHSTAADTIYVGPWMAGVLVAAAAAAAAAALVAATTYIPHTYHTLCSFNYTTTLQCVRCCRRRRSVAGSHRKTAVSTAHASTWTTTVAVAVAAVSTFDYLHNSTKITSYKIYICVCVSSTTSTRTRAITVPRNCARHSVDNRPGLLWFYVFLQLQRAAELVCVRHVRYTWRAPVCASFDVRARARTHIT